MMAEEVGDNISVMKLYGSYAKYNLGFGYIAFILFIQILWMLSNSATNLWLVKWTDYSDGASDAYNTEFYIVGYVVIGFLYAFFALIRSLLISNSSPKMSNYIH